MLSKMFAPENSEKTALLLHGLGDLFKGGSGAGTMSTIYDMNQADKKRKDEAAARAHGMELTRGALTGMMGTPFNPPSMASVPTPKTPEQAIAGDTMTALGKSNSDVIRSGLVRRGLPEHVADGFIANFKDESNLDPGINEINPTVPGSRGGFGLAQWTGPRRVALEQFAQQRGSNVSDIDTQLDFLVHELQGTESSAGQSILSTRNASDAAQTIVRDFLRPAPEHQESRSRRYANMSPERAAEVLQSPNVPDAVKQMVLAQFKPQEADKPTSLRQNVEWIMQQNPGMDFREALKVAKGGTNVTVNNPGQAPVPAYNKLPAGFVYKRDANGQVEINEQGIPTAVPIIGGPEDTSVEDANAAEAKATSANLVLDEISIAKELIAGESMLSPATGITGNIASNIDSTRAGALKNRLTTIKANIGFDKLQSMRDASPTGGALGQVSEFENRLLQSVFGSLEQAQSAEDIQYNLDRLEKLYTRIIHEGIPDEEAREMYRQVELGENHTNISDEDLFKKYGLN
ncbi:phage tail tip lysozyme [uncultured Ruegeria sp.]|uniref:phage tail tip lysozyme n=1 Tax=uncultured Ruegeria sp. TaxID=259304 RepID=UPI0026062034|nr:phage tail tip lysozyme [uncultured Ruegeria sp.]